jgi:hypothetical protein
MTDETAKTLPDIPMDKLAKIYIRMRDKRSELTRDYEAQDAAIKAQQDEVASAMKEIIRAAGGTSMGTAHGTVSLKTSKRYYAQDWDAMGNFIIEHAAPQLLEKRIAQRNMDEFLEVNPGVVPPGLNIMSEITVSVTKPRT